MIAGTLELQMMANMARLTNDMATAKGIVGNAVRDIEKILGALGVGFSAGVLLDKIGSVVEGMDKLQQASEKTGASVENLSKLQFFAGVSGSSIDSVTQALAKLSKAMVGSGNDTAAASQALKFLGLSAKDAAGNLKDPSVLFGEISQKLIGYQDGAGKAAIAQALFGKAGVEMLPTLKKMAELGGVEASVTAAQAAAAEAYRIEVARLNQQKEILWNTVVSGLLPSMQSFVGVLLDASKQTDSLGNRAKGLAADGSIESWAEASAMGVARFVDVLKVALQTLGAVIASAKVVGDDIEKPAKHAALIAAWATPGSGLTKAMGDEMWKEQLDEYAKDLADANKKYADLYDSDKTAFSKAVAEKIELGKAARAFMAAEGGKAPDGKPLNFALGDATKAASELKLYQNALQALEQELGRLNEQTQFQKTTYQVTEGSLTKLNGAHKAALLVVAAEVDKRKEFLAMNKLDLDAYESMFKVREQLAAIGTAANDADKTYLDDLKFQLDLIGKTTIEQQQMNEARKVDIALRAQQKAASDVVGASQSDIDATTARLAKQAEDQKTAVLASLALRVQAERDWVTGARVAFNEYVDNATNAANQTKTAFTNTFKGMEDAMFNYFRHGKLGMTDFIGVIKDQLARLAAQQFTISIVGAVAGSGAAGAVGTGSTLLSGASTGSSLLSGGGLLAGMGQAPAWYSAADAAAGTGAYTLGAGAGEAGISAAGGFAATDAGAGLAAGAGLGVGADTGAIAGGAAAGEGVLAAIPVYGWIALAAIAAYEIFSSNDGPRTAQAQFSGLGGTITRGGGFAGQATTGFGSSPTDIWAGTQDWTLPGDALAAFNNSIQQVFTNADAVAKELSLDTSALATVTVHMGATSNGIQADMQAALQSTADAAAVALIPNLARLRLNGESLGQAFDRITTAAINAKLALESQHTALDIKLMQDQGDAAGALAAQRKLELAAMDATLRPLQVLINLTEDWATKLAAANTAAASAVDVQIQASQTASQTATQTAASYRALTTTLADAVTKIRGGGGGAAGASLQALFGTAMTGNMTALAALPQAATDFLAASLASSRTATDYARDQAKSINMLNLAGVASTGMATQQDYQATLLETQTGLLQQIKAQLAQPSPDSTILTEQANLLSIIGGLLQNQTGVILTGNSVQDVIRGITALGTSYSEQMLLSLVTGATTQADSLQGIFTASELTVSLLRQLVTLAGQSAAELAASKAAEAAAAALQLQITKATATYAAEASAVAITRAARDAAVAGLGVAQTSAYSTENPATGTPGGYSMYNYIPGQENLVTAAQAANVAYMAEVAKAYALYKAIPGHASGGLASGWSMVGERGPELVNFSSPGRVYTAGQTSAAMGGAANDDLLDEIRALRSEVAGLRRSSDATASNTGKQESFMRRISPDGNSITVTVAA